MKTKRIKSLLSLLLVLAIGLSLCGASAFADGEEITDNVTVTAGADNVTVTVGGNPPPEDQVTTDHAKDPDEVTVKEDIQVNIVGSGAGLSVETTNSSAAVAVEAADVSVSGNTGGTKAVAADATAGGQIAVNVGDVVNSDGAGIEAKAENSGSIAITADSVDSVGNSVFINAGSTGDVEVTVGSAEEAGENAEPVIQSESTGIDIATTGGKAEATVNGSVEAGKEGVSISNRGGDADVTVEGDLKVGVSENSEGQLSGANHYAVDISNEGGNTEVIINGNAQSDDIGVKVTGDGKTSVSIEETLSVAEGGTPILIGEGVTENNLSITVWKIEVDGKQAEEGNIVGLNNGSGTAKQPENVSDAEAETARRVENSINYIIKIDPQQTGSVSSNRDTAHANETVTITVTIPEGHTLKAVYTDEGETLTAQDNGDGTFSLTVPVGGGVYVHADFEEIPEPEPEPKPKRKYTQESEPVQMPKQEEKTGDTGMGTGGAPAKNEFLRVTDGTARYELGNGEQKVTLLANTLKTLVKERGLKEFVFVMNGKTYTVKAEDLLAWLASSPSVVLYADGDRLVLDFGGGEVVILESDEALAEQRKDREEAQPQAELQQPQAEPEPQAEPQQQKPEEEQQAQADVQKMFEGVTLPEGLTIEDISDMISDGMPAELILSMEPVLATIIDGSIFQDDSNYAAAAPESLGGGNETLGSSFAAAEPAEAAQPVEFAAGDTGDPWAGDPAAGGPGTAEEGGKDNADSNLYTAQIEEGEKDNAYSHLYTLQIEEGKSAEYAAVFVEQLGLGRSYGYAEAYAEKKTEGKSDAYCALYAYITARMG